MSQRDHHTVFNELLNRYDSLFVSVIGKHFRARQEAQDVYQDFLIHLLFLVESNYESDLDILNTASWLKAVVSNYCKSALRKRHAKRRIQFTQDGFTSLSLENYSDKDDSIELILNPKVSEDPVAAMNHLLGLLSKKDALILKMKYFYGKSSIEIARRLKTKHIDVRISRLKLRLIKLSGANSMEEFFQNDKSI
jgi:RNA polymerase sigma factor (sigma-70 family)